MRKRLSLLLAVVLAMTMAMGMSTTALAVEYPENVNCGVEGHDSGFQQHLYVIRTEIPEGESELYAIGYGYVTMNGELWDGPDLCGISVATIEGWDGTFGWYCLYPAPEDSPYDGIYRKCTGGHSNPPSKDPSGSSHEHHYEWHTIVEPTQDKDGLEGEVCSCGATRNVQTLSAYGYALNHYAAPLINAAKSGQTITFEFGEWNSFPKSFMEKIAAKSDVNFVFHYKWNHVSQEIVIPAGTAIDLNFDWYGPAKMAELYGAN